MGALVRLAERRSATELTSPRDPAWWLQQYVWGGKTASGQRVSAETAIGLTAVWRAVNLLSTTMATLPLKLFQLTDVGGHVSKTPARDHAIYELLYTQPNPFQTAVEFRTAFWGHFELRGNAMAAIESNRGGTITALWLLHPDRMKLYWDEVDQTLWYEYTHRTRLDRTFKQVYSADEIFHVRGFSNDGFVGYSPVYVMREALGVALAAQEHSGRVWANGATFPGVLKVNKLLTDKERKNLRASWTTRHENAENAGKTPLLESGIEWQSVGMSAKDSQFIESRKFSIDEVGRIWGVPPHMLSALDRMTFNNVEQLAIDFVKTAVVPRSVMFEQRANVSFLLQRERGKFEFKHLVDGLLRGDIKTRFEAYAIGRQWGWLSADDIREKEEQNPVPNGQGKAYLVPLNMLPAGSQAPAKTDPVPAVGDPTANMLRATTALAAARPMLADVFARMHKKEASATRRFIEKPEGWVTLLARHSEFASDHAALTAEALTPAVRAALAVMERELNAAPAIAGLLAAEERVQAIKDLGLAVSFGSDIVERALTDWPTARANVSAERAVRYLHDLFHQERPT